VEEEAEAALDGKGEVTDDLLVRRVEPVLVPLERIAKVIEAAEVKPARGLIVSPVPEQILRAQYPCGFPAVELVLRTATALVPADNGIVGGG